MLKVGGHASTDCHVRGCDSPSNAAEVMSKQHDPHLTRLLGKQACALRVSFLSSALAELSEATNGRVPKFAAKDEESYVHVEEPYVPDEEPYVPDEEPYVQHAYM